VAAWLSGSAFVVTQAGTVLGWVTVFGRVNHLGL